MSSPRRGGGAHLLEADDLQASSGHGAERWAGGSDMWHEHA
jgi:hypothetical protein